MGSFFEENMHAIVIAAAIVAILLVASLNENFVLGAAVGVSSVLAYQRFHT